jgi:hypothetical protein
MLKYLIIIGILAGSLSASWATTLLLTETGVGTAAVIPGCASPTAPDGNVDLSQCSNAYYVAVIF